MTTRNDEVFVFVMVPPQRELLECAVCQRLDPIETERRWRECGEATVCEDHALIMGSLYISEGRDVAVVVYGDQ